MDGLMKEAIHILEQKRDLHARYHLDMSVFADYLVTNSSPLAPLVQNIFLRHNALMHLLCVLMLDVLGTSIRVKEVKGGVSYKKGIGFKKGVSYKTGGGIGSKGSILLLLLSWMVGSLGSTAMVSRSKDKMGGVQGLTTTLQRVYAMILGPDETVKMMTELNQLLEVSKEALKEKCWELFTERGDENLDFMVKSMNDIKETQEVTLWSYVTGVTPSNVAKRELTNMKRAVRRVCTNQLPSLVVVYKEGEGFQGLETVSPTMLTMALDTISSKENRDAKEQHILDSLYAYVDQLGMFPKNTHFVKDLMEWTNGLKKVVKEIQLDPDTLVRNKQENNEALNHVAMEEVDAANLALKAASKKNLTQASKLFYNATAEETAEFYNNWYQWGKQQMGNVEGSIDLVTGLTSNVMFDIFHKFGITHLIQYVLFGLGAVGAVLVFVLFVVMYQYLIAPLQFFSRPKANVPVGNVPVGNMPVANVPVGNVPVGNVPVGKPIKATIRKRVAMFEANDVEQVIKLMDYYKKHIRAEINTPKPVKTFRAKLVGKSKSRRRKRVMGLLPRPSVPTQN